MLKSAGPTSTHSYIEPRLFRARGLSFLIADILTKRLPCKDQLMSVAVVRHSVIAVPLDGYVEAVAVTDVGGGCSVAAQDVRDFQVCPAVGGVRPRHSRQRRRRRDIHGARRGGSCRCRHARGAPGQDLARGSASRNRSYQSGTPRGRWHGCVQACLRLLGACRCWARLAVTYQSAATAPTLDGACEFMNVMLLVDTLALVSSRAPRAV